MSNKKIETAHHKSIYFLTTEYKNNISQWSWYGF